MMVIVEKKAHKSSLASKRLQGVLEIWEREKSAYNYHRLFICAHHHGKKIRAAWIRANESAFDYVEQELVKTLSKVSSFEVEMLHSPVLHQLNPSAKNQCNSLRGQRAMEIDLGGKTIRWPSRGAYASSNNAIRQWMATVCLGRAARSFGREQLESIASKNLKYNIATTYIKNGDQSYIWTNGSAKLGATDFPLMDIKRLPK